MDKDKARVLLKSMKWLDLAGKTLYLHKIDISTYKDLGDAFDALGMGYYADILNFTRKEHDKVRNVHVDRSQFMRGEIAIHELTIGPMPVED